VAFLAAESEVTPRVAFPFVQLFDANAHGAFEAVATVLLYWASGWFESFPSPPVNLLRRCMVRTPALILCYLSANSCAGPVMMA
jgi:hypothetical protein